MSRIDENVVEIISTFLKKMRKNNSQAEYSRKLGYGFNIVNRWELGNKKFLFDDFIQICSVESIDLPALLFDLSGIKSSDSSSIIKKILETPSNQKCVSKFLSIQKIRRLINGETKLSFEDFLAVIELTSSRAMRFFYAIFDENEICQFFPDTHTQYNKLILDRPALSAVRMILELKGYADLEEHSSDFISQLTGIELSEINLMLTLLERIGMIHWDNKHFVAESGFVDTRLGGKEVSRNIMEHWRSEISAHGSSDAEKSPSKLLSAYLLYGTNADMDREIFELSNKYYMDLKNIINTHEEEEMTSLKLMNLDLFCPLSNYKNLE